MDPELKAKERLSNLLKELMAGRSGRVFARQTGLNYASFQTYFLGDTLPKSKDNLEKIAKAKGWTIDELEAYIYDRPLPPKSPLPQLLQEIRQLTPQEALQVAQVAIEVAAGGGATPTRLQFQTWIYEKREVLSLVTKIGPDRLLAIVRGEVPKVSELVELAQALGVDAGMVVMLYPELSPARMKQAARAAQEANRQRNELLPFNS